MRFGSGRLFLTFVVAVAAWLAVQHFGQSQRPHRQRAVMVAATARAEQAFAVVDSVKRTAGYAFPADSPVPWRAMLGEDYTAMTTTLGSREAKEVSTNPSWAALMVRLLDEAGVTAGDRVVVLASGSFPALVLSSLAAVVELGAEPVVISSLGASSYGANVQQATLLDLERWVREAGVLPVRSTLVTAGGENDAGGGLSATGVGWLVAAAQRDGTELVRYESLSLAIAARMDLLTQLQPAALVNVGGGQAVLGGCAHAATLPTGLWRAVEVCHCDTRGVLARIAGPDLPVIHLLGIRGLAALYGLDFEPGGRYRNTGTITKVVQPRVAWIVAALAAVVASLVVSGRTSS